MEYLGLLCLGAFVGAIATIGLGKMEILADWRQVLVVVLPALLSGAAMVFVDRFRYSPAFGAFPLGLMVSLLWTTIGTALDRVKSTEAAIRALGWFHIATAALVAGGSTALVGIPAGQQVIAEAAMPRDTRARELQEARSRASWGSSSRASGAAEKLGAAASAPGLPASALMPAPHASAASAAASR